MKIHFLLVFILFITSCSSSQQPTGLDSNGKKESPTPAQAKTAPDNINVTLEFKVDNLKERKPKIVGKTNLPDGMKLLISIAGVSVNYNEQANALVKNGTFETGNFSKNNSPLLPGQYSVEITTPPAKLQSTEIRQIIGENGEKLTGSSVKKDASGTSNTVNGRLNFVLN